MKSIKEKAKRYDEAIKYAHYLINERCKKNTDGSFHRADLQRMFPAFEEESEDERIRKELLNYLYDVHDDDEERVRWIAWLEKQGEKGTNGNKGEFPIPEPPLTIKHAKEVMEIEQKPVWSKEDEEQFSFCCAAIELSNYSSDEHRNYAISFLESLKDKVQLQNTWKPSDEQIEALHDTIIYVKDSMFPSKNVLKKLYGQLKKLKEE